MSKKALKPIKTHISKHVSFCKILASSRIEMVFFKKLISGIFDKTNQQSEEEAEMELSGKIREEKKKLLVFGVWENQVGLREAGDNYDVT